MPYGYLHSISGDTWRGKNKLEENSSIAAAMKQCYNYMIITNSYV